ncbi:MAG: hypothetical protein HZA32_09650 [Opitutae bacterium]|nr:hypothetical protein [Opitutae bacterium]
MPFAFLESLTPETQQAAVLLPPELEALVLPMCQRRQGNGLRSLLCLDSDGSQLAATSLRNPKL